MKEISQKLQEFCEKAELMRLSYIDQAGRPHVVPVWFVVIDGDYCLGTYKKSLKTDSLKTNDRAAWVVDDGGRPHYRGVSFTGRAVEITDPKTRAQVYHAIGEKYFGSTDDPEFVKIYGQADDPGTIYFRLVPEARSGWEY